MSSLSARPRVSVTDVVGLIVGEAERLSGDLAGLNAGEDEGLSEGAVLGLIVGEAKGLSD